MMVPSAKVRPLKRTSSAKPSYGVTYGEKVVPNENSVRTFSLVEGGTILVPFAMPPLLSSTELVVGLLEGEKAFWRSGRTMLSGTLADSIPPAERKRRGKERMIVVVRSSLLIGDEWRIKGSGKDEIFGEDEGSFYSGA